MLDTVFGPPGTRCTRLIFFKMGLYICILDFVFQNLAQMGGGGKFDPARDFGRKGPEWLSNGSNRWKTIYFDE